MQTTECVRDLNPEGLQNGSDSFWNDVIFLLLQVSQLLRVHTAGETRLQEGKQFVLFTKNSCILLCCGLLRDNSGLLQLFW